MVIFARPSGANAQGFTYIGLLIAFAIMAAALAAVGQLWHTTVQRAKEAQLVFVGEQFKRALEWYYENTPGSAKHFPERLEELTLDPRQPVVRRYLRTIYRDPITDRAQWGLVRSEGRIVGIFSLSDKVAFARLHATGEAPPQKYSEWRFVADLQPQSTRR